MHRLCGEDYCLCEETPRQSGTWLLFGLEFRLGATKFFVTYEITFFEAGFEDPGHQGHETQAVQREHALRQILITQRRGECQPVFFGPGEIGCSLNTEKCLLAFAGCPANGPVRIKTPRTF